MNFTSIIIPKMCKLSHQNWQLRLVYHITQWGQSDQFVCS